MPSSPKKRKNGHPKGLFRETFVSATRELSPFGMVFVYPPENFDQAQLGTIFGIVKIADTSAESSFIANLLASVIRKEYFSKPLRPAYDSFEASLKKANLALAELARQGSVKWMGKISFAGGVIEKNNLHFSKLGTTAVLLLRSGALADIGSGLGADTTESGAHPLKTFSDISSGKVENGDCLIFATSDLLEIFSLEEIRQNAARFPREEFPDILSASLTANSELSGVIVVNMVPESETGPEIEKDKIKAPDFFPPAPAPAAPAYSDAGISDTPTARPKRIFQDENMAAPPLRTPTFKKERSLHVSEAEEIILQTPFTQKAAVFLGSAAAGAKNGASSVWKNTCRLFSRINWKKIALGARAASLFVSQKIRQIDWRKRNVRIAAAVVMLAALSFPLFKIIIGSREAATSLQTAQQSPQAAVPSDILNDTNAKNIESVSQVATLPTDSRELMFLNDSIFLLGADKSILKINPSSGETENTDSGLAGGKFALAAAMPDLNTIFILTEDKKMISFTPINKKFQENTIALPENVRAADLKTFLTYLYILDPAANQIYRYPRAESGFGERQDWLKAGADIKNAANFAINDDLFAADRNRITAYLQGKKDEKINFESPNAPLAIDRIFTAPNLENIYALDNKNRRIVRYGKDGKIAAQYWNASLAGVKDFVVDEKSKIIYLQKTDSIWKFSME